MSFLDFPLVEADICNFCQSSDHIPIDYPERYGTRARMVVCKKCGLGFLNPRWSALDYQRFYANDYRNLVTQEDLATLAQKQRVHGGYVFRLCSPFVVPKSRVLDIGSSSGTLLSVFAKYYNCEVFGVEPSSSEVRFSRECYGIDAFEKSVEEFKTESGRWDLILCSQTFNHLLEPYNILQNFNEWLNPDTGMLYLEVQNFPEFARLRLRPIKVDHTYYFNVPTLTTMLYRAGFSPVYIEADSLETWGMREEHLRAMLPSIHIRVLAERTLPDPNYPLTNGTIVAQRVKSVLDAHLRREKHLMLRGWRALKRLVAEVRKT